MENKEDNIISIYTPSVTLNSPEEYAKRAMFLTQLLADKNCPANKAEELADEIINIAGYLALIQKRKNFLKEQQETNEPKDS